MKLKYFITFLYLLCSLNLYANDIDDSQSLSNDCDDNIISFLDSNEKIIQVKLEIRDHRFYPHTIKIPANRKIRITLHNHDSTIEEFESFDLKREKIVLGNSKTIIILAPLKKGVYKFFGEFNEETAKGQIIVE